MKLENKNMNLSWCRDLVGEFSGSETVKVRMRGGMVMRTEKCVGVS